MSLTGPGVLVLLGVLAVVLFVALVLGRPRLRPGARLVAARALTVLALNVVVLAVAGTVLNDQYVFFVGWSDLLGARSPLTVSQHGAAAGAPGAVRVQGAVSTLATTPAQLPPLPQPGARTQTYQVTGVHSGLTGQVLVYLPVGYDPSSSRTYPVIEALHGYPAHPASWVSLGLDSRVDSAASSHAIQAPIVIVPQVNIPAMLDTECINGPVGTPQTETWLAQDVPTFVVTHFRVATTRSSWAVAGFSEGGYCAAMIGMRHPGEFGAAIVLGGYFRPIFSATFVPVRGAAARPYDLVALAGHRPPPLAVWVETTKDDHLSYQSTAQFLRSVRPPMSATAVLLKTGGHRASVWADQLPRALAWLGTALSGFRA